jgi:hypothetical protein
MDIDGVIIFEAESGIPLFSRLPDDVDPELFSGFISAIGHFTGEMTLGGLSLFATEEKVVYLARGEQTITALIAPKKSEFDVASQFAKDLGNQFEGRYSIPDTPQPMEFNGFAPLADDFLSRIRHPFLHQVAIFLHATFGGEVSLKSKMMTRSGSFEEVDIVLRQRKMGENNPFSVEPASYAHNDISLVRAVDGEITRGDLLEFLDRTENYAIRTLLNDELQFRPRFPDNALVFARKYSSSIDDMYDRFPRYVDGRPYFSGTHIFVGTGENVTHDHRCFVTFWKWKTNGPPERIFG